MDDSLSMCSRYVHGSNQNMRFLVNISQHQDYSMVCNINRHSTISDLARQIEDELEHIIQIRQNQASFDSESKFAKKSPKSKAQQKSNSKRNQGHYKLFVESIFLSGRFQLYPYQKIDLVLRDNDELTVRLEQHQQERQEQEGIDILRSIKKDPSTNLSFVSQKGDFIYETPNKKVHQEQGSNFIASQQETHTQSQIIGDQNKFLKATASSLKKQNQKKQNNLSTFIAPQPKPNSNKNVPNLVVQNQKPCIQPNQSKRDKKKEKFEKRIEIQEDNLQKKETPNKAVIKDNKSQSKPSKVLLAQPMADSRLKSKNIDKIDVNKINSMQPLATENIATAAVAVMDGKGKNHKVIKGLSNSMLPHQSAVPLEQHSNINKQAHKESSAQPLKEQSKDHDASNTINQKETNKNIISKPQKEQSTERVSISSNNQSKDKKDQIQTKNEENKQKESNDNFNESDQEDESSASLSQLVAQDSKPKVDKKHIKQKKEHSSIVSSSSDENESGSDNSSESSDSHQSELIKQKKEKGKKKIVKKEHQNKKDKKKGSESGSCTSDTDEADKTKLPSGKSKNSALPLPLKFEVKNDKGKKIDPPNLFSGTQNK